MRKCCLPLAFAASTGFAAGPAASADFSFKKGENGVDIILVSGEIELGDDDHFRRLAIGSDDAVVILSGPGGKLITALEIGKTVQLKGFSTAVPSDASCTSSCALIWTAGQERYLVGTAKVGFHASYKDKDGRQEETGVGNAIVGRFLTLLNYPEKAVIFATSASPSEITWLTEENSAKVGIPFERLKPQSDEQAKRTDSAAEPTEVSSAAKFEWSGGNWRIWNKGDSCALSANFDVEQNRKNDSSITIFVDHNREDVTLLVSNEKYKSLVLGREYALGIKFQIKNESDKDLGIKRFKAISFGEFGKGFGIKLHAKEIVPYFGRSDFIYFSKDGKIVDGFPLEGSAVGIENLNRCLRQFDTSPSDPFAN